mmetsp:Transcript_36582/g.95779  ORF Transcript_36582/g.95779 Transcript_36582/m.95779 type:complete len:268 (-) Transcript_36582:1555-2358(-)
MRRPVGDGRANFGHDRAFDDLDVWRLLGAAREELGRIRPEHVCTRFLAGAGVHALAHTLGAAADGRIIPPPVDAEARGEVGLNILDVGHTALQRVHRHLEDAVGIYPLLPQLLHGVRHLGVLCRSLLVVLGRECGVAHRWECCLENEDVCCGIAGSCNDRRVGELVEPQVQQRKFVVPLGEGDGLCLEDRATAELSHGVVAPDRHWDADEFGDLACLHIPRHDVELGLVGGVRADADVEAVSTNGPRVAIAVAVLNRDVLSAEELRE